MKFCTYCNENKEKSEFHTRRKSSDGLAFICKACKSIQDRAYRRINSETLNEKSRQRWHSSNAGRIKKREFYKTERGRELLRLQSARYRAAHPEKVKARSTLNHAIRDGKISRKPCEFCGESKTQAHHHDYSKPLDVRWVCHTHHTNLHMEAH